MQTKMFSDGEAVKFGWKATKDNIGLLIGLMVVGFVATVAPMAIGSFFGRSIYIMGFFTLLTYLVAFVVGMGFFKVFLKLVRGEAASFGDLFNSWNRALPYLGVSILYGLIVFGGFLLFVIPGVIWAIKYYFAPLLVLDKGMGPIEALKASAEMTDGIKWDLLGFYYVIGIFAMLGYLALFVGIFVTMPAAMIAAVFVYVKLSEGVSGAVEKPAEAPVEAPAQKPAE